MIPVRNAPRTHDERGIALVAAVLVVLLSTLLVATFMLTTTGERTISSNVQTAKESLYAADAGVRTQQQQLANLAQTKIDSCVANWGGAGMIITSPGNMFPNGTFTVASANPQFTATGTIVWSDSNITPTAQTFDYRFTIQSTGAAGAAGARRVQAMGLLRVSASRGSFADYLVFLNSHTAADGSPIWFTSSSSFDGRVHANGILHFAFKPTFQDIVSSHDPNAQYYNNGSPVTLNASNNGALDVPNFYNGFQRNTPLEPLPTDGFNQQSAAIGGPSVVGSAPTNSAINAACGTGAGSGTPPNGIYVVSNGGIYVQGNLTLARMWADTSTNCQWYQLVQGGTVRTICVDPVANTTVVWNSASSAGTPNQTIVGHVPNGSMYVNGGIADLRGPDRNGGVVDPAIAQGTKLLITAANDIVLERDVTCDRYDNNTNVLGLFSTGGSIRVGASAPDDMNLDAFVMAIDPLNGQFTVDNYDTGSARGAFHLRGGLTESYYGPFFTFDGSTGLLKTGFSRDYHYDKRGLIPPFYPTTTRFNSNTPTAHTVSWKEI